MVKHVVRLGTFLLPDLEPTNRAVGGGPWKQMCSGVVGRAILCVLEWES